MFSLKGIEIPTITIIAFAITAIWSAGMIIAPMTLPPNSVKDLTGRVGIIDNAEITEDMNPYAKFYYQAGDSQCHTIKERSLFINGNQMPFCARDAALFLGMALGLGITLFIRFPLKLWWLIGGLVPLGLDGTLQLVTSYESNNALRVITGGLAGMVTMFALGFVLHDMSRNMAMRKAAAFMGEHQAITEPQEAQKTDPTVEDMLGGKEKEEPISENREQ